MGGGSFPPDVLSNIELALIYIAVAGGADTSVGAPMIDLIDNRILLIVGCTALVLAGLFGVLSAIFLAWRGDARRRQLVSVSEVTRDWQPTWKINAVTDAWVMEHEKDDIIAWCAISAAAR
jgi:hypothetical protein